MTGGRHSARGGFGQSPGRGECQRWCQEPRLQPSGGLPTCDEAAAWAAGARDGRRSRPTVRCQPVRRLHEQPFTEGSRGFGSWPATQVHVAVRPPRRPGIHALRIHRGKRLLVSGSVAAAVDPLARAALAEAEGTPLVAHLAAAGPVAGRGAARRAGAGRGRSCGGSGCRSSAAAPCSARSVTVPTADGGHRHTSELWRWDQEFPADPAAPGGIEELLVAGVQRARWSRRSARSAGRFSWPVPRSTVQRLVDEGRLVRDGSLVVVPGGSDPGVARRRPVPKPLAQVRQGSDPVSHQTWRVPEVMEPLAQCQGRCLSTGLASNPRRGRAGCAPPGSATRARPRPPAAGGPRPARPAPGGRPRRRARGAPPPAGRSSCCWRPPESPSSVSSSESRSTAPGSSTSWGISASRSRRGSAVASRSATGRRHEPPPPSRAVIASERTGRVPRRGMGQQPLDQHRQRLAQRHLVAHRLGERRSTRAAARAASAAQTYASSSPRASRHAAIPPAPKRSATAGSGSAASSPAVRMPSATSSSAATGSRPQPADRQPGEERRRAPSLDHHRPARPGPHRGHPGGEAAGPRRPPGPAGEHRRHASSSSRRSPAVQPHQPVGREQRPARLDAARPRRPATPAGGAALGGVGDGARVGGGQLEPRAAGDRLADPHPRAHAEGGGGRVHLADQRRAARLRAERDRRVGQRPAQRHPQREAGDEDADDQLVGSGHRATQHRRTCVRWQGGSVAARTTGRAASSAARRRPGCGARRRRGRRPCRRSRTATAHGCRGTAASGGDRSDNGVAWAWRGAAHPHRTLAARTPLVVVGIDGPPYMRRAWSVGSRRSAARRNSRW